MVKLNATQTKAAECIISEFGYNMPTLPDDVREAVIGTVRDFCAARPKASVRTIIGDWLRLQ